MAFRPTLTVNRMNTASVKKASEYRKHAKECRTLAQGLMSSDQREQLLKMAETWEKLALERAAFVLRHPELALGGEHKEEVAAAKSSAR
jgi:glutamine synthetase adenylyltransferase